MTRGATGRWALLLASLILVPAGGCGRAGSGGGDAGTITLWHPWGGPMLRRFDAIMKGFEHAHAGTRVSTVFTTNNLSSNQKLFTAIAAGTPPDAVFVDGPQVASWAEAGALEPLTGRVAAAGIRPEMYFPPTWRQNFYNGEVWALTYCADPNFGFVWNKDAFRRAGLDPERPPTTIAELSEMAGRLTVESNGLLTQIGIIPWQQYGPANSMFTWGWCFGGEFYRPEARRITADDPRVVEALEWMVSFARKYDPSRIEGLRQGFGTAEQNPFYSGKMAMMCLHIGGINDIERYRPDLDYGVTFIPNPPRGEPHSSWVGGWCLAIPRGSRHPEAAWELIRWLCSTPEGTTLVGQAGGLFPGLRNSPYFAAARKKKFYDQYVRILEDARHQRPVMPAQAFYMRELLRAVDASVYGRKTPLQALRDARRNTQAELDLILGGARSVQAGPALFRDPGETRAAALDRPGAGS